MKTIPLTVLPALGWLVTAMPGHPAAGQAASPQPAPQAVAGVIDPGAAMAKMETPVEPERWERFKQQHPAKFWLFGEDRQLAVRNRVIPAHWFADGEQHYQRFSGVARPGEFYVFQTCLVRGKDRPPLECKVSFDSWREARATVLSRPSRGWPDAPESFWSRDGWIGIGGPDQAVFPLWIGVQVPTDARPGTYRGQVSFRKTAADSPPAFQERLDFAIQVEGAVLEESGTGDPWRLARLKWLDSDIGEDKQHVTRPFTPVRIDYVDRTLDILGRRITLGRDGIPAQLTSHFSASNARLQEVGTDAFRAPPRFECLVAGKPVDWQAGQTEWSASPTKVSWFVENTGGGLKCGVTGTLEFDGCLQLSMTLSNAAVGARRDDTAAIDGVRFVVPWNKGAAKYAMGLGLQGGPCPDRHQWNWDVSKHQDAIWLGDVNLGAMLRFKGRNFRRPLINAYYDFRPLELPESWGGGGIRLENSADGVTLTAHTGPKQVTPAGEFWSEGLRFDIDWYLTPFKPLDLRQHFTDRYYHAGQGAPPEDTAKLKAEGVNILEIHHNRLCNPYINYPYNSDSFPHLQQFVKQAHDDGVRVALYYTTRELTQNLPEFFALKSMAGEIILPRREGVAWPVTNRDGPHPWLRQHVGDDIVPAWRENLRFADYPQKLDLAVITTPDSRWNNFYLEGLDYLVKKAGIDGLYIDDTALDRTSMQRARRILDADGNPGRRISMHSWNHFNGLAKWANSAIAFMELYPYYDGLWYGEGFNANAPPEYMLVEMSGIPYGLMSEMLDHPNPWHGMVFGMRVRWPWSGDPRQLWKLEDEFGIADAEYLGWWDPACPVQTGHPQVKASVYRKKGSSLVALASWAKEPLKVKLRIDWPSLGLDPAKASLRAPACPGFQDQRLLAPADEIPLEPNKGWLWILGEAQPADLAPAGNTGP